MSKASLQAAQLMYDECIKAAIQEEKAGRPEEAIRRAMDAWEHLEGMMKFERKWEDKDFKSVPCIDLVLRNAPLLLDFGALDRLADLLKAQRSIDRLASDDLAARLQDARQHLRLVYRVLTHIEATPGARPSEVGEACSITTAEASKVCEKLVTLGVLQKDRRERPGALRVAMNLDRMVQALCERCGAGTTLTQLETLTEQTCRECGEVCHFVLRRDEADAS